ncbi:hypothetical protein VTI74DRAFT_5297 [Chaetomium olivicolor]
MNSVEGTLCRLCSGHDIHDTIQKFFLSRDAWDPGESRPWYSAGACDFIPLDSPWHTTLGAVDISSSSCGLCRVIMKGWQQSRKVVVEQAIRSSSFNPKDPPQGLDDPVARIPAYRDTAEITLQIIRRAKTVSDGRENRSSLFLHVQCNPAASTSFDVLDPLEAELRITRESHVNCAMRISDQHHSHDVHVDGDNSITLNLVTDVAVSADPLSQESLDIARGWLETCLRSHGSACCPPRAADGWIPTRLLEVPPGSGKIYLRESGTLNSSIDTRFVALSHCWGQGGTPFTTTRETLSLRMEGIEINSLPQTFRDSVTLVERFGVRYVWIDSLCIIQDDAEDWAREAAQMANVYRNAHLVLNAANSDADMAGFLRRRSMPDTVVLPSSATGEQHLRLRLLPPEGRRWSDSPGLDNLTEEPVSSRAWCLQERYLPVRALQYGTHQAFWECGSVRASEDGDAVAQEGDHLDHICRTANIPGSVFSRPERDPPTELEHKVNWVGWYRMIENYTTRTITKHTDRLPALSGLAQAVVRKAGGEYMAGLWKSGLLEGLLWCRARSGQILYHTPEYVAPTWSWASLAGPVQFPVYSWYTNRAQWKAKMSDLEPLAEYLRHSTAQQSQDPYGMLKTGRLSLKAPLLPVVAFQPRQTQVPILYSLFGQAPGRSEVADLVFKTKTGAGSIWIEGGFDNPDDSIEVLSGGLFVAFLARLPHVLEEGFVEQRFGLLLKADGKGGYVRVGFIDGVLLKKSSLLDTIRGRGLFSVVGYPRPYREDDIYEVDRHNDLATDPLRLEKLEVPIS